MLLAWYLIYKQNCSPDITDITYGTIRIFSTRINHFFDNWLKNNLHRADFITIFYRNIKLL